MSLAHKKPRIAIIGGGPAGLVAAKSLLEESLQPVVFEQSSALGGQWHAASASAFGCITSPDLNDAQMAGLVTGTRAMPEDTSLTALLSMLQEATGQR